MAIGEVCLPGSGGTYPEDDVLTSHRLDITLLSHAFRRHDATTRGRQHDVVQERT